MLGRVAVHIASKLACQEASRLGNMSGGNQFSKLTWRLSDWKTRWIDVCHAGQLAGLTAERLTKKQACQPADIHASVKDMMIVFANSKGGVGKSTLAVHCAVWLHDLGFQTALIDTDKQRSSSVWIAEAEPQITVRTADTPEEYLTCAQELLRSHDLLVGDAPGGLEDLSRTLLILADLAIFPISPSILDVRSVAGATAVLRYAQGINKGRPEGRVVLNKMKTRDTISRELQEGASQLGLSVAAQIVRDLQAYRDVAQQGTVVSRTGKKGISASADLDALFKELLEKDLQEIKKKQGGIVANG